LALVNKNRDLLDWIKFFVFIGSLVAGVMVWYYSDVGSTFVNKDVYNAQQVSITEKLDTIQNSITESGDEVKSTIRNLKNDVNKQMTDLKDDLNDKHDGLNNKVDRIQTQQAVIKSRQSRLIEDVKKINNQ